MRLTHGHGVGRGAISLHFQLLPWVSLYGPWAAFVGIV